MVKIDMSRCLLYDVLMKDIAYICIGSCLTDISQEEFDGGKTKCTVKDCTKFDMEYMRLDACMCGKENGCCQQQL